MKNSKNTKRNDGYFKVSVYIGIDSDTNKRKEKVFYGKTMKEAQTKADKFKKELEKSSNYAESYNTFGYWSDKWLAFIKKYGKNGKNIGISQLANYEGYTNNLKAYLEKMPLNQITADDIQGIIGDYYECNPHTKKPSSKKTLTDLKNTASNIFNFAIEREVIYRNPVSKVSIPAAATVNERRALTDDERKMIEETPNPRGIVNGIAKDKYGMQLPAMIMLYAGLRRGECICLKWSDIDLQNGTITVNKAVEFDKNQPIVKNHTKTDAGMRTVHISDKLIDYLKKVKLSRIHNINALVCPALDGKIYTATSWRTGWNCYMQDLDVKYGTDKEKTSKFQKNHADLTIDTFTPHCLRHTFGSMLYAAGIDIKTIQIEMGHTDIKTTMNRYVHVDTNHCAEQMKKMNEYQSKMQA